MKDRLVRAAALAVLTIGVTGASKPVPSLSAYVGKYPSDKVAGMSLYRHPKFRALVGAAAPSDMVRTRVLTLGVEAPVERQGALIVAQMCEPHDCNDHQWTVAILLPNGPAALCYHDSNLMGEEGRWFIGVTLVARTHLCWEGAHTNVPDAVFMRLAKGH